MELEGKAHGSRLSAGAGACIEKPGGEVPALSAGTSMSEMPRSGRLPTGQSLTRRCRARGLAMDEPQPHAAHRVLDFASRHADVGERAIVKLLERTNGASPTLRSREPADRPGDRKRCGRQHCRKLV